MTQLLLVAGLLIGLALNLLLVMTLTDERLRIWPTPGEGSWQSLTFWSLFRALNIAALAMAALDWGALGLLPDTLRWIALAVALVCAVLYLRSLVSLGPPNTYCQRAGLVERGIYRWTRNPQYATVIPAYVALAVAADSEYALLLIALLVMVYVLMAYAEEPWLKAAYHDSYARYAARVPRFYNWRRTRAFLRLIRRLFAPAPLRFGSPQLRHLAAIGLPRKRQ